MKKTVSQRRMISLIAGVAIFSAIAIILYVVPVFQFKIPIFPSFLEVHLDEIPIFIAGYAYGPIASTIIIVIRTLIKLPQTSTICIGEVCDLILSLAFVLPSVILYKYKKSVPYLLLGIGISFLSQLVMSMIITTFVMVPWFFVLFPDAKDGIINLVKSFAPSIENWQVTYAFCIALPFNAIKNSIVVAATLITYFPLQTVIKKARASNSRN